MNNTAPFLFLLLFISALALQLPAAHAAPERLPTPKWLETLGVAQKMVINGIPSTVQHFEAYKELEELLAFYRQQWNDGTPGKSGYREAHVGLWHILSRLDRQYLYTVQVQADDSFHIQGYLAVADLKEIKNYRKDTGSNIPRMEGSQIINDVTSVDPGTKGRTLLLANSYSISSNSAFYRNYYKDRGWGVLMDTASNEGMVLAFKSGSKETHLVLGNRGEATTIVMNIIERN